MRAVFFGTPEIAVPALEALTQRAEVVSVVCQPDKPAGRGLDLRPPPVKVRALELGLDVTQPTKVRPPEFAAWLRAREADVALVMAYGRILPKAVLEAPRRGCLNLHASLLPAYRGAAPIQWAIVRGETVTGISLMQMDEGMDTGPVLATREVPIGPDVTAGDLAVTLAGCAANVVLDLLEDAVRGALPPVPQDHDRATHAPLLEKEDGRVDWRRSARRVHDHVRGMSPWPGAFTHTGGRSLKILETRIAEGSHDAAPGTVLVAHKDRIEIACGEGRVALLRAQLEGRRALPAAELVGGRVLAEGALLGVTP